MKSRDILSKIVTFQKYARYSKENQSRESWEELVERNQKMHIEKHPKIEAEIRGHFQAVLNKKVLPSMRSFQFAGKPIELSPNRMYNCAYAPVENISIFSEAMFLLLGGTGLGYSVQKHHVRQLPKIIGTSNGEQRFLVSDNIEGWADAVKHLFSAYVQGKAKPVFDLSDIREKGAMLVTSGGKAPGPLPLKNCLYHLSNILDEAIGRQLRTLECHDALCHIADAVLAGGIRRAAMIALFSLSDQDMLLCKSGNWYEQNGQRARANNSVMVIRNRITETEFKALWRTVEVNRSGEPGLYFSNDRDLGTNPCCLSENQLVTTKQGAKPISELVGKEVDIWDGECWRKINNFRVTAEDQKLLKITMHDGSVIEATPYHKFFLSTGEVVDADALVAGDSLRSHTVKSAGNVSALSAYIKGFMIGDGTCSKGKASLTVHSPKYTCLDALVVSAAETCQDSSLRSDAASTLEFVDSSTAGQDRRRLKGLLGRDLALWGSLHKKTFPAEVYEWTEASRASFIAGIMDANGTAMDSKNGFGYQIGSIEKEWMLGFQLLLKQLGVQSTLRMSHDERTTSLPGGEHLYKKVYRLSIAQEASILLAKQVSFVRLKSFADRESVYRASPRWNKIAMIETAGTAKKVYCCTVDGTKAFALANGIITHNCEISLKPYQFCNLTTINGNVDNQADFNQRARSAAFLGTLQASYTDFHYLRSIWKETTQKEALIGVSITGIASGQVLKLDLEEAARIIIEQNKKTAAALGINPAARTTCVKPEGTSSLVLGTSSGIHAWHSEYYLRRIKIGKNEALYSYLKNKLPEYLEDDERDPSSAFVVLPIKAPENAITREEPASELLARIARLSKEWVKPGHVRGANTHNVSATVTIKDTEWKYVGEWVWENRSVFNGLAMFPYDAGTYIQTPFEDCTKKEYELRAKGLVDIDLTEVKENKDETDLQGEIACAGGACEVAF